jgi:hypothetical protein
MVFLLIVFLAGFWLWPEGPGAAPPPAARLAPAPPGTGAEIFHWPYYQLPERLTLCGERVPLDDPEVREDLDREFIITVWSRAQTTMWLKRAHRHFPEIEKKLRGAHLPNDLKYVVLVESDLRPKARSSAGALGPWQFMQPTAQRFQLKCNDTMDERLDFGAATDAALNYLKELGRMFPSWPLALAAYNCGEARVQKEIAAQGVADFYHLALPDETERYVHRILGAKIVLENPARYGFEIPPDGLYPPPEYDEAAFVASREVPVRRLAEACGTYYKTIKRLNPWIKGTSLAPGAYRLKIPKGTAPRFYAAYHAGELGAPGSAPASLPPPAANGKK